jgi:dienelactone hydrolase
MRRSFLLVVALLVAGCGGGDDGPRLSASPYDYDRGAPLEFRDLGRVNRDYPIEIRNVSFASPQGGRVTAYLVRPPGKGPFPGAVYMHGAGGNRNELVLQATWLAGRGAVALVVDSPFARNPNRQIPTGLDGIRNERDLIVQNVVELRRAVDVLQDQPQVDDDRIGFLGFSAGARTGAILAGVEDRIDAYDLLSGGSAPVESFARAAPPELRDDVSQILGEVDPIRLVRGSAPASMFFQDGRRDELVPRAALLALYRAAGRPKQIRWYPGGHEPSAAVFRDGLAWLSRELGLRARPVAPGVRIGP